MLIIFFTKLQIGNILKVKKNLKIFKINTLKMQAKAKQFPAC